MARERFGSETLQWVQCVQPSGHILRSGDEASNNGELLRDTQLRSKSPRTESPVTILCSEHRHDGPYTSGAEQTVQTRGRDGSVSSRLERASRASQQ
jgi:hypothetical protein